MRTSYWKNGLARYKSDTTRFVLPKHRSLSLHFFRSILSDVLQWNKSTTCFARDEKHNSIMAMCSNQPSTRMKKTTRSNATSQHSRTLPNYKTRSLSRSAHMIDSDLHLHLPHSISQFPQSRTRDLHSRPKRRV